LLRLSKDSGRLCSLAINCGRRRSRDFNVEFVPEWVERIARRLALPVDAPPHRRPSPRHDITQAEALTAEAQPEALLGDKGYRADAFIESLEVRAIKPVIRPKSNRPLAIATSPFTPNETSSSVLSIPQTVPSHLDPLRKDCAQLPAGLHLICALAWLK
jgi:Transposase DDE domain